MSTDRITRLETQLAKAREIRDETFAAAERCKAWGGQSYVDRMAEYANQSKRCRNLVDALSNAYAAASR